MQKIATTFRSSIQGMDSPHQLAAGVALGLIIGLIPKDSLLPYIGVAILLASRANLLTAALAAVAGSLVSGLLAPSSHLLGGWILHLSFVQSQGASWLELPLVSWTRFNNTVVMGSLAIGLLAAVPIYLISKNFFRVYGESIVQFFRNSLVVRWFVGPAETDAPSTRAEVATESTMVAGQLSQVRHEPAAVLADHAIHLPKLREG